MDQRRRLLEHVAVLCRGINTIRYVPSLLASLTLITPSPLLASLTLITPSPRSLGAWLRTNVHADAALTLTPLTLTPYGLTQHWHHLNILDHVCCQYLIRCSRCVVSGRWGVTTSMSLSERDLCIFEAKNTLPSHLVIHFI